MQYGCSGTIFFSIGIFFGSGIILFNISFSETVFKASNGNGDLEAKSARVYFIRAGLCVGVCDSTGVSIDNPTCAHSLCR